MGPENAVKAKVKKLLDEFQVFHWPAAASPYGVAGVPDRLAIVNGICVGIEVKAPGKKPTPHQSVFGLKMALAGGQWFLVDGDEALACVRTYLEENMPKKPVKCCEDCGLPIKKTKK
jgi:hypothetical protein